MNRFINLRRMFVNLGGSRCLHLPGFEEIINT